MTALGHPTTEQESMVYARHLGLSLPRRLTTKRSAATMRPLGDPMDSRIFPCTSHITE